MSRKSRKKKCNNFRKKHHENYIDDYTILSHKQKNVTINPRNVNQQTLMTHLQSSSVNIIFAIGPAGTGKTYISTLIGINELKLGNINKIVITRPNVSTDEQLGFLPGDIDDKMAPWILPIRDIFEEYYSSEQIDFMIKDKKIEISPLAYMRGRSFKNAWIIADECQLTTSPQMKMLLTRIGENCTLVITGDLDQADHGSNNGLQDFLSRFNQHRSNRIKIVRFEQSDIERHPIIAEILSYYK